MKFRLIKIALLASTLIPAIAFAATDESPLKITAHTLHTGMAKAELCLTFDKPIALRDRKAIAQNIQLFQEKTKITVTGRDLSLTPTDVCIQQLEHGNSYHLAIDDFQAADGGKLDAPFTLSFQVPDQKSALNFILGVAESNTTLPLFPSQNGEPLPINMQAVNVDATHLALYRILDKKSYASAYGQFEEVSRAPSESLTFAKQNGKAIWQNEATFNRGNNTEQIQPVSIPANLVQQPGLYFLAAIPHGSEASLSNPSLITGLWFAVSDLKIIAMRSDDGIHIFAHNFSGTKSSPSVTLQILDNESGVVASGNTNADGYALLPTKDDAWARAFVITATDEAGNVALLDPVHTALPFYHHLPPKAVLSLDRTDYKAGSVAVATMELRDSKNHNVSISDTMLRLVRPDQSVADELPVTNDKSGLAVMDVPLPFNAVTGNWALVWHKSDGTVLSQNAFSIRDDRHAAKWTMASAPDFIEQDGHLSVTIKATDYSGKPLPYASGTIKWQKTKTVFPAWKDYSFGNDDNKDEILSGSVSFIADESGTAHPHLTIPVKTKNLMSQSIRVTIDIGSAEKIIPIRSNNDWVGIQSSLENSTATFQIIALDDDEKRKPLNDVYYHLYEEGRAFKWYQADGRWDYHSLPQHRRVGGGRLNIAANGNNIIQWPVTAGHYVLDILDASGTKLASKDFEAGQSSLATTENKLALSSETPLFKPMQDNKMHVKLDRPSSVGLLIGDDAVRQPLQRFMPEGTNEVAISPQMDWGNRLQIIAQAGNAESTKLLVPLEQTAQQLELIVHTPNFMVAGTRAILPVTLKKIDATKQNFVRIIAIPENGSFNTPSIKSDVALVDHDGRATINLDVPQFSGVLRLEIYGWNETQSVHSAIKVPTDTLVSVNAHPPAMLSVGDQTSFDLPVRNNGVDGVYTYALSAPSGLKIDGSIKGSLKLHHNQTKNLSFKAMAISPTQDVLRLGITSGKTLHQNYEWPVSISGVRVPREWLSHTIAPNQTFAPVVKNKAKNKSLNWGFIAPVPLRSAMAQLETLSSATPYTTEEIAGWLEAMRVWHPILVSSGFVNEDVFAKLYDMRRVELLKSQKTDGGFAKFPDVNQSDIASTAAALTALEDSNPSASTHATLWMQHRLENTWFDEGDRHLRAAGFLALSRIGKVDVSALRYFADTSKDKTMPPLAYAQLALAFAQNHDDDAARDWLQKAHKAMPDMPHDDAYWALWETLSNNPLFDTNDAIHDWTNSVAAHPPFELSLISQTNMLRAASVLNQRAGFWRLNVNGMDRQQDGFYRTLLSEKTALRNNSDRPLFIMQRDDEAKPSTLNPHAPDVSVQRQVFHPDGTPVDPDETFRTGKTYIVVCHAKSDEHTQNEAINISIPQSSAASIAVYTPEALAALLPWLPPLSAVQGSRRAPDEVGMTVTDPDWRIAYLMTADRSGSFTLPPLTLRNKDDQNIPLTQNKMRMRIQAKEEFF